MDAGTWIMWVVMDFEDISMGNQPLTVSVDGRKDLRVRRRNAMSSSGLERALQLPQATVRPNPSVPPAPGSGRSALSATREGSP